MVWRTYEDQKREDELQRRTKELEAERAAKIAATVRSINDDRVMDIMEKAGVSTTAMRLKRLGLA